MSNNQNSQAILEMDNACLQLQKAYQQFLLLEQVINASYLSFQSAGAASVNKDMRCYQEVMAQIQDGFEHLQMAKQSFNQAFEHPNIQKMIEKGERMALDALSQAK